MAGSRTLKLSILADVDDLKKKLDTGSNEVEGFAGKLEKFGKVAATAFAAAAAAAAAYAGKLAIDGVKAAIEDEAAQQRLANALKNVTGATDSQIKSIEDQIYQMSLAFGIADDKLRPAFQRLAVATGDVETSQKALRLALDISAATGKDLESVSNALGKAYEGNTGALAKLGVGMSASEMKALGLNGTMDKLAQTFGGAATTQANTLEGQMNRLKVLFDETKESVGAGLLPIVKDLLDYFTNRFIPMIIEAKNKALDPIKKAFDDNKESMRTLWQFTKDYLVPIFETTLVKAIEGLGKSIASIVNIVGSVINEIKRLANGVIDTINTIITAYNKIPILPDIPTISKPSILTGTSTGSVGNFAMSTGTVLGSSGKGIKSGNLLGSSIGGTETSTVSETVVVPQGAANANSFIDVTGTSSLANQGLQLSGANYAAMLSQILSSYPNPAISNLSKRTGEPMDVIINVNAPSVIDKEGFTRAVADALNESLDRGTGGGDSLRFGTVAL